MGKLRYYLALLAAKLSIPLLKITKHNGTNYPGELAIKICPDFLAHVGAPEHIVVVTGTNGKTTVCNMLCDALETAGRKVMNNRYGSNIASGIATSLIRGAGLTGKSKYEYAVLEVDERSAKRVLPYVRPDYMVITNLFRDSIMRNAHPQYIADFLSANVPAGTKMILNADDLISCRVAPDNPRVYFGIEKMAGDITDCINRINDLRVCPLCAGKLEYEYRRYHHIGRARCRDCGFASPAYDYAGRNVDLEAMTVTVSDKGGDGVYILPSESTFNIYNVVTVVSVLRELGFSHEKIAELLAGKGIVSSRYNEEKAGQVTVIMQMAKEKNALACSRAFDYVSGCQGEKELLLMMNCLGDVTHWSENTCWLYDCDFEFLNREDIPLIVVTGARAKDYYFRLLLAGVPAERLRMARDEMDAAELLDFKPGRKIYMFYGTDSLNLAWKVHDKVLHLAQERSGNHDH